jgi:hypothetical protein
MNLKTEFQSTVSAIGYSIIHEKCPPCDAVREFPHNASVRFLIEQHGRMPGYLQLPLMLVTIAFDWSSMLRHGRRFHRLPHTKRWRSIEAWRNAPLAPCRDFIRLFESLTIFYWYSQVVTAEASARGRCVAAPDRTAA